MKKTLLALAFAAALPGVAQAASFQDIATLNFTATSSTASFLLSWEDLISANAKKGWSTEVDGKYSLTLTDSITNQIIFNKNSLGDAVTGDVAGVTSGSFVKTFSSLSSGAAYTLSFIGTWSGPNGVNWATSGTPSVSMAPVPEPETYAMFLAGLGIIGMIAKRRKNV